MSPEKRLRQITEKHAHLDAEEAEIFAELATPWPKKATLFVHGGKEYCYEQGMKLGLDGEALEKFSYTLYELRLDYIISRNGDAMLLAIDGIPLPQQEEAEHG